MIASTHDNEENLIIPSLEIISKKYPSSEFILVPRHPERSKIISDLLQKKGLKNQYHSQKINKNYKFLVIDSLGKMDEYFNKSDIVFLGGSFSNKGGHNPIEAATQNCVIITGSNVFNWQNLFEEMSEKRACYIITDPVELGAVILKFIEDKNLIKEYKDNALKYSKKIFFEEHKLIEILNKNLGYNA